MKKILIFKLGDIAYSSTRVFADELGRALQRNGAEVEYFDFKNESAESLEKLAGSSYDAMIDFNSRLPGIIKDENENFLDTINAPFFNYILDHPIYHHANLERKLKNYHVITIDDTHTEYIKKYYPHIMSVTTLPLGAIRAENLTQEREHDILFSATYLNPSDYYEMIQQLPGFMKKNTLNIIEQLMADTDLLYENAVLNVYENQNMNMEFPVFAQSHFLADIYVRAYFREKILELVAQSGVSLTVCGEKYHESPIAGYENVQIKNQVPYRESLSMIARSKFVLNVMPWFKSGIHDRVFNAMINGAVCITDGSRMMERIFTPKKDYIGYSLKNLDEIPSLVREAYDMSVRFPERHEEMVTNAESKVQKETFEERAKAVLSLI